MKIVYAPKKGSRYLYPRVKVGEERDVTDDEAKALVKTGSWRRVKDGTSSKSTGKKAAKSTGDSQASEGKGDDA